MKNFSLRNIEQGIWWLFLFVLPWQTRVIVWQADAQFIEWRSASVYLTDVLFVALMLLAVLRLMRNSQVATFNFHRWDYALLALLGASLVSVYWADHRAVAWFALVRLAQGVLLYAYVRWYALRRFSSDGSLMAFVLGVLAQMFLGLGQFAVQHDIGIRWAGETLLTPFMQGVAVFYDLAGTKILRAYGTLPHPNVLAAFAAFALAAVAYLSLRHSAATVRRAFAVWAVPFAVLVWGLAATFSRTVIAATVAAFAVPVGALALPRVSSGWANIAVLRRRVRNLFIVAVVAGVAFGALYWPQTLARMGISGTEEAVQLRAFYNAAAFRSGDGLWGVNWFGTGIGNFVSWLHRSNPHLPEWQYQPAHNLYLLVYTEAGIAGTAALAVFCALLVRGLWRARNREPLVRWGMLALAGFVLFIALFDHFFWTLQQGRLLFWMFWGCVAGVLEHARKS